MLLSSVSVLEFHDFLRLDIEHLILYFRTSNGEKQIGWIQFTVRTSPMLPLSTQFTLTLTTRKVNQVSHLTPQS